MSAHTNLSRYIGLEVPYTIGSLDILVKILDAKRSYGHTNYLITPLAGSRCVWVRSGLTFPTEGA